MKYKIFIILFSFFGLNSIVLFSQEDIIEINNTSINVPDKYDFGNISEAAYSKYIIKNNRNSLVTISNIKTPPGFFATISNKSIAAGKKVILYFGLDPNHTDFDGDFNKNIVIKTNLITDIVVKMKGHITKIKEGQ